MSFSHRIEQCESIDARSAAFVEDALAVLREAFDAEFRCWVKEHDWRPVAANNGPDPPELVTTFALPVILDRCVEMGQPFVATVTDGQHVLVLPIPLGRKRTGTAVGSVRDTDVQVIQRIAKSVLRTLDATRTSRVQEEELRAYARHLGQSFEELSWLRDLTGFIEYCDATSQISTVAEQVFPSLTDVLVAESLALVDAPADTGTDFNSLDVTFQSGPVTRADDVYRWLVRRYRAEAKERPFLANTLDEEECFARENSLRSCMVARIAKNEHHYGWLVAVNKKQANFPSVDPPVHGAFRSSEYEFGTFEASLMESASVVLATQARNAELFRESDSMFIGVIRALAGAIDAKDPYTCGHSDRVARIARRVAEELGWDAKECEQVYVGGLLHDIGKIGVSDEVLLKPGRLTADEFEHLKKHPEIGFSILKHVQRLEPSLPGVLHHHERIDGTGYPSELAADKIPWPARVISVADTYDAMTSRRPYRDAMSFDKAEAILREHAGTQWDARVVEAFLSAAADIHRICRDGVKTNLDDLAVGHSAAVPITGSSGLAALVPVS